MMSPQKNVEKMSEELRNERNKANSAMSESARYRIEIVSLQDSLYNQSHDIDELRSKTDEVTSKLNDAQAEIDRLLTNEQILREELAAKTFENKRVSDRCDKLLMLNNEIESQMELKNDETAAANIKLSSLERRVAAKEESSLLLSQEIQTVRNELSNTEQRYLDTYQQLREVTAEHGEMRTRLEYLSEVETSFEALKLSNEDLREACDAATNKNELLTVDLRILSARLEEREARIALLDEGGNGLIAERDQLARELSALKASYSLQASRIEAEVAAADAAREQADAMSRGREGLAEQIAGIRHAHQEALAHNTATENRLAESNALVAQLQAELSSARSHILELSSAVDRAREAEALAAEVDHLRVQLLDVKRQLARRDVADESGSYMSQEALEQRESKCRAVYEDLINDLRLDVEQLNNDKHDLSRRFEDARRQSVVAEQLREELKIYKEMSVAVEKEKQKATLATSEAQERSLKISQEINSLRHQLHQLETELKSSRLEVEGFRKDNATLRETLQEFHASRIGADRKTAETLSANSKLQIQVEDQRQRYEAAAISVEKLTASNHELRTQVTDLQIKAKQLEALQSQFNALNASAVADKSVASRKEKALAAQVELLQQSASTQQLELAALQDKAGVQRAHIDSQAVEMTRMRAEIERLTTEKDRFRREVSQAESLRTEQQLADLRKDLDATVSEWEGLEREKSAKDKLIAQLQGEFSREKERNHLLVMNHNVLEDRLRVVTQELSVFRSLDVYHSSMQMELQSYRKDKSLLSQSPEPQPKGIAEYSFDSSGLDRAAADRGAAPKRMTVADMSSTPRTQQHMPPQRHSVDSYAAASLFQKRAAQSLHSSVPREPVAKHSAHNHDNEMADDRSVLSDMDSAFDLPVAHPQQQSRSHSRNSHHSDDRFFEQYSEAAANETKDFRDNHSIVSAEDAERSALLQSRNERKAMRYQLSREKILRESAASVSAEKLKSTLGSAPGTRTSQYQPAQSLATQGTDNRESAYRRNAHQSREDDASQSSLHGRDSQQGARPFRETSAAAQQSAGNSNRLSNHPSVPSNSFASRTQQAASLGPTQAAATATPVAPRPGKIDFKSLRKLL